MLNYPMMHFSKAKPQVDWKTSGGGVAFPCAQLFRLLHLFWRKTRVLALDQKNFPHYVSLTSFIIIIIFCFLQFQLPVHVICS